MASKEPVTTPVEDRQDVEAEVEEERLSIEQVPSHKPEEDDDQHQLELDQAQSHVSNHDMPMPPQPFREANMEQYQRFSPQRKSLIVAVLSFCSFLAPVSSTSILSAVPEVASTFNTTGSIVDASNALYIAFMGLSAPFWGPVSQVYGRRPVSI